MKPYVINIEYLCMNKAYVLYLKIDVLLTFALQHTAYISSQILHISIADNGQIDISIRDIGLKWHWSKSEDLHKCKTLRKNY